MKTKNTRLLVGVVSILMMISMACQLPFASRRNTASSTPPPDVTQAPAAVESQPTSEPLPPEIVEADPPAGSTIQLQQQFVFIFNQPMDQSSVERALAIAPAVSYKTQWLDDRSLELALDEPLTPDSTITLTFSSSVLSANGLPAADNIVLDYGTAGRLLMTESFPEPDQTAVNPRGLLMVSFNQPVVDLGTSTDLAAFDLSPAAEGYGEWLNTSTYIFHPQPGLNGGTEYTLRLNEELTSRQGAGLELAADQSAEWTFRTSPPRLLTVEPQEGDPVYLDASFTLTFNQPMDTSAVEENFRLEDGFGESVVGKFAWSDDSSILTFTPKKQLSRNTAYRLRLGADAAGFGGVKLGEKQVRQYQTVGNLAVQEITPSLNTPLEIYSGYSSIQIKFNAPITQADFTDLISIEPALIDPYFYTVGPDMLILSGFFAGNSTYRLTLSRELKDQWGQAMDADFQTVFSTKPLMPQLIIPLLQYGFQDLFVTSNDVSLPIQAVNISEINIMSEETTLDQYLNLLGDPNGYWNMAFTYRSNSWSQAINLPTDTSQPVDIFLNQNGETLIPGLYQYQFNAPGINYPPVPFVLVVSDMSIAVKYGKSQVFAWAVDLNSGLPASNIALDLYTTAPDALASCVTDVDGQCTFDLSQPLDPMKPVLVVHGQPGDMDFGLGSGVWRLGVNGGEFGFSTYPGASDIKAYLYTDRPIYRSGQTVYFRVIARHKDNARYSLPDLGEIHLEVYGNFLQEIGDVPLLDTIPVKLSDFGSGWGSFTLPEDAESGNYSLHITELEDVYLGFRVADYRKPEIDLQVQFTESDVLQGGDLTADVSAAYYFGASAANVPVHWVLYSASDYFDLPFGYQTGNQAFNWQYDNWQFFYGPVIGAYITEGNGQTGQDGSLKIDIPFADYKSGIKPGSPQRFTLEVNIQESSELPVSARSSLLYHPEVFYIGVRTEQWSGIAGSSLGFAIQTADIKKNAAANIELKAELKKIHWITERNAISGYIESTPEYTTVSSVNLITDVNGQSRVEMTPDEPGTYLLEVTGGRASTQVMVWVGGSGSVSWPNLSDQQLPVTMDKEKYQVGETARLFIPNPFSSALALITVEREGVLQSQVVMLDEPQLDFSLPIVDKFAPNVYASIILIDTDVQGNHDFRQGYVNIPVDTRQLSLQMTLISTPDTAEPGGSVVLLLTANDWQGNPVQGEFSVSLVDKAVLALVEPNAVDILKAFYDNQPLGVQSSLSLAGYAAREITTPAGGLGGGGDAIINPFIRQDFRDTAYWNGNLVTDMNGNAEVVISLPDNVTTWVALARGMTKETLVGETQIELTVSKPLLVSPIVPKFVVAGDRTQVAVLVHNNTKDNLSVDVSLQVSGFVLDADAHEQTQETIAAGGSKRVSWWGTVQNAEQLDFTFSAVSGNYLDAAVPELGSIPVLHYSSPETFATSGVISEAGEILETVSLPHTYQPTGGQLTVELAPSLAASILMDMKALQNYDSVFTETLVSRLLPNLEMLHATQVFEMDDPDLVSNLTTEIQSTLGKLIDSQSMNGGWGWMKAADSDAWLSSYVLMGLSRAVDEGFSLAPDVIQKTQQYVTTAMIEPDAQTKPWELDRLVFQQYALVSSGVEGLDSRQYLAYRDLMNPWGKALLALCLAKQDPNDADLPGLLNEIQSLAEQTATGVHWTEQSPSHENLGSTIFNSSVVVFALAKLDPASGLLPNAIRYLVAHRNAGGGWNTSYDSAWSLRALIEVMKGTGELQGGYDYSASVNGTPLIEGQAEGINLRTTVTASTPVADLLPDMPNALRIQRDDGDGKLYYRAYLQVDRPVEDIKPVERGLSIERSYSMWGVECTSESCPLIQSYSLANADMPVLVHVNLTVPEEMFYVVVEDWLPAGAEIVDTSLLISQQGSGVSENVVTEPLDPTANIWGSWYFGQPEIRTDHIRWVAVRLPAGSYELTYRFVPYLAGEYRTLPARAWQYYFPEVSGSSQGGIFTITE